MSPNDPNVAALFSAIRALLLAVGGVLFAHGLGSSGVYQGVELVAASIMTVGPLAWGVYVALHNIIERNRAAANGVSAGINLTTSGQALALDGKTVVSINDGSTPPKPVTIATAQEIIKNFGPSIPLAAK
jgi:hypothetical protein